MILAKLRLLCARIGIILQVLNGVLRESNAGHHIEGSLKTQLSRTSYPKRTKEGNRKQVPLYRCTSISKLSLLALRSKAGPFVAIYRSINRDKNPADI